MKYQSKWEKNPWQPKKIIYEATDEKLTASAGLGPLIDAFMASPEFAIFKSVYLREWPTQVTAPST